MYNFSRNFGLLAAKMYSHIIYYYVTGTKISAGFLNVDIRDDSKITSSSGGKNDGSMMHRGG